MDSKGWVNKPSNYKGGVSQFPTQDLKNTVLIENPVYDIGRRKAKVLYLIKVL